VEEALELWEGLASGRLAESAAPSGAVADAGGDAVSVATAAAGAVLAQARLVPLELLLPQLPWVLSASPRACLALLRARGDVGLAPALQLMQARRGASGVCCVSKRKPH
jgi:hypothetical protein